MSALSEIVKFRRNPEAKRASQPVGEKAKELWSLIAPDRQPDSQLPTAILPLYYDYYDMNFRGRSFERRLFDSVLRPYWQTKDNISCEAKLHINPNYFNHGMVDKGDSSFVLYIDVPSPVPSPQQPPNDNYISVFGFAEFPQSIGFGPFKKHQANILIIGEGGNYTGDLSRIMIGKPTNLQTTPFKPGTKISHIEAMLPGNTAWREKFATDIVNMLIDYANNYSLEQRKSEDKLWQETFTRQRI